MMARACSCNGRSKWGEYLLVAFVAGIGTAAGASTYAVIRAWLDDRAKRLQATNAQNAARLEAWVKAGR